MPTSIRARAVVVAVVLAGATGLVAACGDPSPPPPPPPGSEWVPSPYRGWGAGYETFCLHGNRVIGGSGGGMAVAPNDPSCKTP